MRLLRIHVFLLTVLPGGLVIGPLGGIGAPATVLAFTLLGLWACFALIPSLGVRPCVPVRIALAGFWVAALASYALRHRTSVPAIEATSADSFLVFFAAFSGLALTAAECLRTRDEVLTVLRAAVTGAAFSAAIGVLQFLGTDLTVYLEKVPLLTANHGPASVTSRGGFNRPPGTAVHPIEFGIITAISLGFALHFLLYDKAGDLWRRRLCFGFIALVIPISISRSTLLVAGIMIAYFLAGAPNVLRLRCAIFLAGLSVIIFLLVPGLLGTLKGLVFAGQSDSSISTRTSDYGVVALYVRPNPWLGRGPGTFLPSYRILDNQYLLTLIEMGIIGAIALVNMFATTSSLGRAARRHSVTDGDRNLSQMFRATGIGLLVGVATFDGLSFPALTAMSGLWMGLAGAWWLVIRSEGSAGDAGPPTPAAHRAGSDDG